MSSFPLLSCPFWNNCKNCLKKWWPRLCTLLITMHRYMIIYSHSLFRPRHLVSIDSSYPLVPMHVGIVPRNPHTPHFFALKAGEGMNMIYTESVTILSNARGCALCDHPLGVCRPHSTPKRIKSLPHLYGRKEPWIRGGFFAFHCGVGGTQGAQSPAWDNIMNDFAYIIHIYHIISFVPYILPCYQGQDCR